ncbi:MAG: cation-translocating P-type ATPase [Corallococcus sp.]|nr:cation-translocating P-type ATPase [Corallococcus sp.]MCM1359861.1 cation-translocating P-type ATPase [Corallococcus sp.]
MAQKEFTGLTTEQAQAYLAEQGENVTQQAKRSGFAKKFFSQFGDLMIIILLVAAALSFALAIYSGETADILEPVIIVLIVLANAFLGAFQEFRAEKSLDALKSLTSPKTKVFRDGELRSEDSRTLVVGDICVFESGDVVTADCILKTAESFFVNQSALTGESVPVEKRLLKSGGKNDDGKIFSGSFVTKGRCVAEVVATGAHTELGKIAGMLASSQAMLTPLQQKLKQLSKVIGIVCLSVCLAVLVIGFVKGVKQMSQGDTLTGVFINIFLTSVSLAVAAIPEGLPAVVTVVLAKGIEKMASKNAVVKRLTAVEALGSATVICSDKTGTLTQNKMTLVGIYDGEYRIAKNIPQDDFNLQAYCWCCDAVKNEQGWLGDPTEIAVTSVLQNPKQALRLYEIPFDSNRKLMTVVVKCDGRYYSVTKGSLEAMRCAANYSRFEKQYRLYTKRGLRVLALSVKEVQHSFPRSAALENDLNIKALFTIVDPPRSEAVSAVATCKSAGIRPVMITGDNLDTATEIAKNLGIMQADDKAVDGDTLSSWSDGQLEENVSQIAVYARVTPADKLRIVNAWKKRDAVVAMTGDGVNDAPALKNADIGCAMGSGTEVAKDASDIILTDDNFATIVDAVSLGRSVYENIKKSVTYLLTCNIGEVLSVFVALLVWNVSPLTAMQLLWINLVTDGLPGLALGIYKQEDDVMKRPPKKSSETFFSGGGGRQIAFGGVLFAAATLGGYAIGNRLDAASACTMAYLILSMSQLFYVLEMRSRRCIFTGGITPFMMASFGISVALVGVVAFTPAFRDLFGLTLMPAYMYFVALALSLLPTVAKELRRFVVYVASRKRGKKYL